MLKPIKNTERYYRSFQFISALSRMKFTNAKKVYADVNIIELENSVPCNKKEQARQIIKDLFSKEHDVTMGVRINNIRSCEGINDLSVLLQVKVMPEIVVVPIILSASEVTVVRDLLRPIANNVKIFALIETASSIANLKEIGKVSSGLIFRATNFFAKNAVNGNYNGTTYARYITALTAADNGILAVDTPCFDLDDREKLLNECLNGNRIGFHGKQVVCDSQVEVVNDVYSTSNKQIFWVREVVAEYERSEKGIYRNDGIMLESPYNPITKKILFHSYSEKYR